MTGSDVSSRAECTASEAEAAALAKRLVPDMDVFAPITMTSIVLGDLGRVRHVLEEIENGSTTTGVDQSKGLAHYALMNLGWAVHTIEREGVGR
jgi:hypothetical protein